MAYPLRYVEEERRRSRRPAAATRRAECGNVAARRCSSLADHRGYAALLAPCAARPRTQRGHGAFGNRLLGGVTVFDGVHQPQALHPPQERVAADP